jgi:non-specific serine/threonine protein kinase
LARGIEKGDEPEKSELLKKMIYPFVMRRKKQEVETELPEKIEIVSKLPMEEEQLKIYGETARFYREELDKEIDEKGVTGSSMKILEGMLRLRQICLFPRLVDEKFNRVPSAKFDHFKELLEDILAEDHKVLVFSQFVQVLKMIRGYCDEEKYTYSYIDGSVKVNTREQMVKSFQEDEGNRVFLLSLKAGGTALNLTAADYVIIFDPWWNPAVEAQAIDRSHRIGQTKKVMVYRMVVKDSIEEKMLVLQEKKKALVENLVASDAKAFKNLKKEDILDIFKY